MLAYFIQGLFLGFPAAATPGPLQAYYLSQTMETGWRRTLPSALAPLLSDGPIILLVVFILTRVPDEFLRGLRIAGGLFVLYLAFNAYRQYRRPAETRAGEIEAGHKGLLRAVLTNLLNPNPYIFWSVVAGPILIGAWRQSSTYGAGFLLGFYGTLLTGLAVLIIFFGLAGSLSNNSARLLSGFSALALLFFGLYQLWTGIGG